jgi:MFS family permease
VLFRSGIGFNPLLLAAMSGVAPTESGLASGIVNTAFMMGGALGLAVLASLAASRTDALAADGEGPLAALNGGYHVAFLVGAIFVVVSAAVAGALLRSDVSAGAHEGEAVGAPATAEAEF